MQNFDFNLKYDFTIFEDFIKNTLDKKMIDAKNKANKKFVRKKIMLKLVTQFFRVLYHNVQLSY